MWEADLRENISKYLQTVNSDLKITSVKDRMMCVEVLLELNNFTNINSLEKILNGLPFFIRSPRPIIIPVPEKGGYKLLIPKKEIQKVKFSTDPLLRGSQIFLGIDENGDNLLLDLFSITHTIIAGATGSGKSMCIHAIMHSLLHFDECDIFFLDPKMVECQMYTGAKPVKIASNISDIESALSEIKSIMKQRYQYMSEISVRDALNRWVQSQHEDKKFKPIVVIVDEIADLFSESKRAKEEILILSSAARAAGIRIFLSTQRPDAKIIDGAIKANCTTRICFKTSSRIDSMIVLGFSGAQNLAGKGHGIMSAPNGQVITFQGAFVDDVRIMRYTGNNQDSVVPQILCNDIKQIIQDEKTEL